MTIVSGVAKEQKRTRLQKHVTVLYGSVAVGDRLYFVQLRDVWADLESGFVRRGSFRLPRTLAAHRTNGPREHVQVPHAI